jgi:hypothetical protein
MLNEHIHDDPAFAWMLHEDNITINIGDVAVVIDDSEFEVVTVILEDSKETVRVFGWEIDLLSRPVNNPDCYDRALL